MSYGLVSNKDEILSWISEDFFLIFENVLFISDGMLIEIIFYSHPHLPA